MRVEIGKATATIHRDNGPKIYRESLFWRHVQRTLGKDWIAKLMQKDGHMMGDGYQHYARRKDWKVLLYQLDYAIQSVYQDYNREGLVVVGLKV